MSALFLWGIPRQGSGLLAWMSLKPGMSAVAWLDSAE